MNVACQSSRNGARPRLIVLHDTESHDYRGITDIKGIGNFFNNPRTNASSHVCVDGDGHSGQFVPDEHKAWHCMGYNSVSLGIEQIGLASFGKKTWLGRRAQLRKTAQYIAYWSKKYDIPIRRGIVSNGRIIRSGVVTHAQLGSIGGGHHDPGRWYPTALVRGLARYYRRRGW